MRIGLDIDNVIADLDKGLLKYLKNYLNPNLITQQQYYYLKISNLILKKSITLY